MSAPATVVHGLRAFRKLVADSISTTQPGKIAAVLLVSVEHLQDLRIDLGFDAVDFVLDQITSRVTSLLREEDTIERIDHGGLALFLPGLQGAAQAELAAAGLLGVCEAGFEVDGRRVSVKPTVGIAIYPNHGETADAVLRSADLGLQRAQSTSSRYRVYSPEFERPPEALRSYSLEQAVKGALGNDEMQIYLQPKVRLRDGALVGAEALTRWRRPVAGMLPPYAFIPLIEQSDLLLPFTNWTLNTALRQCADLFERHRDFSVAVNLSPRALSHPEILPVVSRAMNIWCDDPRRLVLEVTEGALFSDSGLAIDTLNAFHNEGIKLAIDDFGTGYSSLSKLGMFPVSELKIDKSFVLGVTSGGSNAQIVKSVINLAHNFGMSVVGEGIEDLETLHFLDGHACDCGQGYFIAKPMPVPEFEAWVEQRYGTPTGEPVPDSN